MNILVISGSAREENRTQFVSQFLVSLLKKRPDLQVESIDPLSCGIETSKEAKASEYPDLHESLLKADAYAIVCPEYNHSFPGSLKMLLDMIKKECIHKPVALVGVSSGVFGGARAIQSLLLVVRKLGMVVLPSDLLVSEVEKQIHNGVFLEPETWQRRAEPIIEELLWMAELLKSGREK